MSRVKSPVLFFCSLALAAVFLGFAVDRGLFLLSAVRTRGSVVDLSANNGSCRCGRHCHYSCTKFRAQVSFETARDPATLWVGAGTAHGYDQPVTAAIYDIGSTVAVAYNPRRPTEAYRDSFMDIWGTPLITLFMQIATFVGSFAERRHTL